MDKLHPFQINFCGYSGSGKTTLIESLIQSLSSKFKVGYFKHDAHKFSMDKEGKDTYRATQSGASFVSINDTSKNAVLWNKPSFDKNIPYELSISNEMDLIFVEGYKRSSTQKIVLLDSNLEILKIVNELDKNSILAFVGEFQDRPKNLPKEIKYFHRDQVSLIEKLILEIFNKDIPKVIGIVLSGGKSSRMQRDKGLLQYHGKTQVEHTSDLLKPYCDKVFVSLSDRQIASGEYGFLNEAILPDKIKDIGPLGGILSAFMEHKDCAFLVAACDLPYLNDETISFLMSHRDPFKMATCFLSSSDGLPEPLCTIFEPKAKMILFQSLGFNRYCPRKILLNSSVKTLDLPNQKVLDNINHPFEYEKASHDLAINKESNHERSGN